MASDDVHDLFDTGGSEDADEEEEDPGAEEPSVSAEWDEFRSMKESAAGGPGSDADSAPSRDAASEAEPSDDDEGLRWGRTGDEADDAPSPDEGSAARADAAETDSGDAGPDRGRTEPSSSTSEVGGAADAAGESGVAGSSPPEEDEEGGFEMGDSTQSSGSTVAGDADAPDSAGSAKLSERADPDDGASSGSSSVEDVFAGGTEESGRSESTAAPGPDEPGSDLGDSASSGGTIDDADPEPTESNAATGVASEDAAGESPSAESTMVAGSGVEDVAGDAEPSEPTGPSADRPAGPSRETDSGGPTPSAEGARTADRAASGADAATGATNAPSVDDRSGESGQASPDEPASGASGTSTEAPTPSGASGSNRLPTGIDVLDEAMGGGVPPGRLVVLVSDPGVQSELIVDSILAQRDTLYVTTDRPDWEVQKDIEPGIGSGDVVIRDHSPDSLLSGLDSLLDELGTSSNFVLDSVNELELVPRNRYRVFLSDVKQRLFDTGSIGLLTGVTVGHESARDLTLRRADIVLRLETRTNERQIENLLSVPKFRGGAAMTETVKLELTDEVKVDTSWNEE